MKRIISPERQKVLNEIYTNGVLPLIHSKKYEDAFRLISQYPEIKNYLFPTPESHEMYSFAESHLNKGAGLTKKLVEGKTKPTPSKEMPLSAEGSWGDSR